VNLGYKLMAGCIATLVGESAESLVLHHNIQVSSLTCASRTRGLIQHTAMFQIFATD